MNIQLKKGLVEMCVLAIISKEPSYEGDNDTIGIDFVSNTKETRERETAHDFHKRL